VGGKGAREEEGKKQRLPTREQESLSFGGKSKAAADRWAYFYQIRD